MSTTGKHYALVVGINNYPEDQRLSKCVNDANDLGDLLETAGYKVTRMADVGMKPLLEGFHIFTDSLPTDSFVVIHFSGHGCERRGENYLIPLDGDISEETTTEETCVSLNYMTQVLAQRVTGGKAVIFLDACRQNEADTQFKSRLMEQTRGARAALSVRSRAGGMARGGGLGRAGATVDSDCESSTSVGLCAVPRLHFPGVRGAGGRLSRFTSLIAFAAAPGTVALEPKGSVRNGFFSGAILDQLRAQGTSTDVRLLLAKVGDAVKLKSKYVQCPWVHSCLPGDTVLLLPSKLGSSPVPTAPPATSRPPSSRPGTSVYGGGGSGGAGGPGRDMPGLREGIGGSWHVEPFLKALDHNSQVLLMHQQSLATLRSESSRPENKEHLMAAVPSVVLAMKAHRYHAGLAVEGLAILCNLSAPYEGSPTPDSMMMIVGDVKEAMAQHSSCEDVVERGLCCLFNLSLTAAFRRELAELEVAIVALAAMRRHPHSARIRECGEGLLARLTPTRPTTAYRSFGSRLGDPSHDLLQTRVGSWF